MDKKYSVKHKFPQARGLAKHVGRSTHVASSVVIFQQQSYPELLEVSTQGHTKDAVVMKSHKVLYAGATGGGKPGFAADGIYVALSAVTTTSPLTRIDVGVTGYVQWANDQVLYAMYLPDAEGFYAAIDVDPACTIDSFQVNWLAYWLP